MRALIFSVALLFPTFAWGHSIVPITQSEPVVNVVLQEAANEPFDGMIAVAGVVFDRVEDRRWPSTVHKVVYQPAQFVGIHIKMRKYSRKQIEKARIAVALALAGIRPYGNVFWYHNDSVKPYWRKKLVVNGKIGAHIFYGDRKMNMYETYLAKISWPPNSKTVYARLSVPATGAIPTPLSIRATFQGFSRHALTKGTEVEVERTDPKDARRYRITKILPKTFYINVQDVDAFRRHQAMAMSKDRVRFFIGEKYFGNSLRKVLQQAFDMSKGESLHLMQEPGFWVVCRPSQFARFMIFRNAAGIQNGFMDLRAELVAPKAPDAYAELADITGVSREDVKKIVHAIGYTGGLLSKKLRPMRPAPAEIDVGGRAHQICYSA